MANNIKSLFTEEEWEILRKENNRLCDTIQDYPLHFDVMTEQQGENNESINHSVTSTKL